ncbi:hypothetical protein MARCHEWKA_01670 [Brevundimonas phage vB_BpoS-Marchewka]|uniref:Uncharacterized protein n=1 Tax=Brevundimonas phage vB_BpoS-Marchewka TaxID=2948604 RepID=A0A9E7N438_9CAUD|nr:hypothetical protein MARCHEWKA_01670 [Brevundimonas phage vB_BpoS-Marchewka]
MSNVTQVPTPPEKLNDLMGLGKRDSVSPRLDPLKSGALLHCTTDFVTPFRGDFQKNLNEINKSPKPRFRQT